MKVLIDPDYGEHDLAAELDAQAAAGALLPPLDREAPDLPDGPLEISETDFYDTTDFQLSRVDALEWELFAAVDHDEAERFLLQDKAPLWMTLPPGGDLAAALEQVRTGVESPLALIEVMKATGRLVAWAESIKIAAMASFYRQREAQAADIPRPVTDERGRPADPLRSAAAEIAAALRLSPSTVDSHISNALRLTSVLSSTYSALRCGAISLSKALTIADATSHLGLDAQHAVEEKVLTRAPNQTNAALKASVRRAVARVDARREAERHKDAVNDRQCRIVPLGDGMAGLWITHTADKIRVLYAAIQALANAAKTPPPDAEPEQAKPEEDGPEQAQPEREEPCGAGSATPTSGATSTATAGSGTAGSGTAGCAAGSGTAGSGTTGGEGTSAEGSQDGVDTETGTAPGRYRDDRTAEQRRADVAVEVFECILSNGLDWLGRKLPDQHRRRPHIEVLVPVTTLLGMDDNPCELTGYGPIPAEMARAIATDGTWRRILTDPVTGEVVEAATTRYQPGVQVTETLLARYPVCDWFGCNRPARECERDHTEKFLNSGITKLQDLRPRCKNHHTIKDTEAWGWKATADPDGGTTFSAPTGHRYRTTPATPGPIADDYRNDTASYAPGTSSDDHDDTPPF